MIDVCAARKMSRARLLAILPRAIKGGHVTARGIEMYRGATVSVAADAPFPIHIDGEYLGRRETPLELRVIPRSTSGAEPARVRKASFDTRFDARAVPVREQPLRLRRACRCLKPPPSSTTDLGAASPSGAAPARGHRAYNARISSLAAPIPILLLLWLSRARPARATQMQEASHTSRRASTQIWHTHTENAYSHLCRRAMHADSLSKKSPDPRRNAVVPKSGASVVAIWQ
jgi:hypothetical protein